MNQISTKAISNLNNVPRPEWPAIYHNLNSWKWDDRLGVKPEHWDSIPEFYRGHFRSVKNFILNNRYKILRPVMNYIRLYVGERELLHYNYVVVLGKTEDEFRGFLDDYLLENKE